MNNVSESRQPAPDSGTAPSRRKNDLRLLAAVLLLSAAGFAARAFLSGGSGMSVRVSRDGTVTDEYSLDRPLETVIDDGRGGFNTLHIRDGEAWVTDANCPDGICEKAGHISRPGEVIVCMPHRLIITVTEKDPAR